MSNLPDCYYTRRFLAVLCFIAGFVCGIGFFVSGMTNYILLVLMVIFFIFTYFIAPYAQGRQSRVSDGWDILLFDDWLITGFFHLIIYPFRLIVYVIKAILD
ncbi:MAG: hypothetical protein RR569_11205 [Acinetobacter sp.]